MSLPMPTWSMPTASTNALMPATYSPIESDSLVQTPITPPVSATTRAWSLLISRGAIIFAIRGFLPARVSRLVWETITGRVDTFSAPSTVSWLAWPRLTMMPSRLHSLTTAAPKGVRPPRRGGLGVDVAERLDLIAFIVQQLEVPEPALVHLFDPLEVSFKKMAAPSIDWTFVTSERPRSA